MFFTFLFVRKLFELRKSSSCSNYALGGHKGFLLFTYQGLGQGYAKAIVINPNIQERGQIASCGLTQKYFVVTLLAKFGSEFLSK